MSKAKAPQQQRQQSRKPDSKPAAPKAPGTKSDTPPRLLMSYRDKIVPQMTKEFEYENVMEVPRVAKVVVNIGIGEAKDNDKALDAAVGDVVTITGQKPSLIKARKSVAAFKLREGQTIGIKTTLRGLREQVVFPEIDYDKIDKLRGLEVSIVTTARNDDEARSLLTRLGMPFRKS